MSKSKKYHGRNHKAVKRLRLELVMSQGNRCYWCDGFMTMPQSNGPQRLTDATLEHIVPIADGGSRKKKANLAAACLKCNTTRPTMAQQKHAGPIRTNPLLPSLGSPATPHLIEER